MSNKKLLLFVVCALIYLGSLYFDDSNQTYRNPQYQTYIEAYRKKANDYLSNSITTENNTGLKYSSTSGTVSNFEGPQVHLKGIKFHNEFLTRIDERLKHFDGVSAQFDPDHPFYGLPDVKIHIKDVRLYDPDKGKIGSLLRLGDDNPKPYKVYKKLLVSDSTSDKKFFEMQLWLTEFDVTIDIRPDRDVTKVAKQEDKEKVKYPAFWYGGVSDSVTLGKLQREFQDQRYGNISFVLEVIPNKSPIYVQTNDERTSSADFAIAAIYCTKATIGNEKNEQRINTNVISGQPLFLNNELDFDKMNINLDNRPESISSNVARIIDSKTPQSAFIWNKPYYIKLHFNNLGSWRSGLFNYNQFHDQVTYSFLMPVFVVGSWDVIAPQEVLPEWDPPPAYVRKFTFRNLLPFWNTGWLGKIGAIVVIAAVLFVGFRLLVPFGKNFMK